MLHPQDALHYAAHTQQADCEHYCILLHAGSGRRCIVDVTLDRSEVRTQLRLGGGWFLVLVTTQQDNFSGGFIEYE